MNTLILLGADLVAIILLTCVLYLRRHRRRDLMVSYLGVNIGVLAVTAALSGSTAGIGLGLGLFGVLFIIRLRSTELAQHEVAYYFAALALGLIGGIGVAPLWLGLALMGLIVAALWIADHPAVLPRYRHQQVILDRALGNDDELTMELERLLGGRIHSFTVQQLDLVNDKTLLEVRYEAPRPGHDEAGNPGAERHDPVSSPLGLPRPGPAVTAPAPRGALHDPAHS